jgi:hypothetical protein
MSNWADLFKPLAQLLDDYRFGFLVGAIGGTAVIVLVAAFLRF